MGHSRWAEYEQSLSRRVADWPHDARLEHLDSPRLQAVAGAEGVDFATRLLYERVRADSQQADFIQRVEALKDALPAPRQMDGVTLAIAPGAFYRELPHIDADGRLLREIAARYGCRTELIPVPTTGRLSGNARCILDWLLAQPPGPIILTSLSKGGADVRLALKSPEAGEAFQHVAAWFNVCGMLHGTPLVPALFHQPLRRLLVRTLFRLRGFDFQMIRDLEPQGPLLSGPLELPPHLRLVSVVGFPLKHQMTNWRARMWRRNLDSLGPNDGGVLLADVCRLPGHLYPVWGSDHYLSPARAGTDRIAAAILHLLGTELELFTESAEQCPTAAEAVR